jgi:hypothetical protein
VEHPLDAPPAPVLPDVLPVTVVPPDAPPAPVLPVVVLVDVVPLDAPPAPVLPVVVLVDVVLLDAPPAPVLPVVLPVDVVLLDTPPPSVPLHPHPASSKIAPSPCTRIMALLRGHAKTFKDYPWWTWFPPARWLVFFDRADLS